MVKNSKKIEGHLELDKIKEVMKEYKNSYNMYRKLLVISMVYQGKTISQASNYVHASRKSRNRAATAASRRFSRYAGKSSISNGQRLTRS